MMPERYTVSTGFIYVSGYAIKIRKVMFALLRDKIKAGEIKSEDIAKASAELNTKLFPFLTEKLKLEKRDVIRIRVDFVYDSGKIEWVYPSLQIEVYKKVKEEDYTELLEEEVKEKLELTFVKTTGLGDKVYKITKKGQLYGVIQVTPVDEKSLIRGVLLSPPRKLEKILVEKKAEEIENWIKEKLSELIAQGEAISEEEAKKITEKLMA